MQPEILDQAILDRVVTIIANLGVSGPITHSSNIQKWNIRIRKYPYIWSISRENTTITMRFWENAVQYMFMLTEDAKCTESVDLANPRCFEIIEETLNEFFRAGP